ncbi:MAG TPA: two-component regulator propeller domain-containing protein [Thermoanaerobaculia bacterium]|nr:two-component regulator propeller domain-containing protein [Thermoanaerobaculia bacterium]
MSWYRIAGIVAAVAACPGALWSLDPGQPIGHYGHDLWSVGEGLPQSTVQEILQTRDGYLWLGTEEGLARFDGLSFTIIDRRSHPELRNPEIRSLLEEPDGSLLIGTWDGLYRLSGGKIRHLARADGRSFGTVESLWRSPDGTLWIGTQDEGLVALGIGGDGRDGGDGRERVFTTADGLPGDSVWALWQGGDGVLWIGTDRGLARYAGGRIESLAGREGLPRTQVAAIRPARGGGLWVAGRGGISLCRRGSCKLRVPGTALLDERVQAFWEDREGNLWIGSRGGLDRVNSSPTPGLSLGFVRALFEDREGSLWIGSNLGGLHRLRDRRFSTLGSADGLPSPLVYSLAEDPAGTLWVGTAEGLARGQDGRFEPVEGAGLPPGGVAPVLAARSGALWLGLRTGLARFEGGRARLFGPADGWTAGRVQALFEDQGGALWIGTQQGLFRHERDPRGERFTPALDPKRLPCPEVLAIAGRRPGSLWIGLNGCGLVHLENGAVRRAYTTADGLGADTVNSVYEDSDGTVWAATKGGGLSRLGAGGWTTVTSREGLPGDTLYQILDDGRGFLWLTSNRGVVRVAKTALTAFSSDRGDLPLTVYGVADGMDSAECNGQVQPAGWRGRDGRLWLPTVAGAVVVDPARMGGSAPPLPVVIERLVVDGEPLHPARELRFPPGKRRFEISYTALTFLAPERVRYRVRLKGFDGDWLEAAGRRSAVYTNLPPGPYRFEVKAAGRDGIWRQDAAAFDLYLAPRLHQRPWFYPALAALLAGMAWLAYRWRVRQLHRRFDLLLAERNRIAREIHDVLAQGMTGAALQLEGATDALGGTPGGEPREAVTHLERARELLRGAMAAARRAVWNLRAAELEQKDLGAALQELAVRLASPQGPRIEVRVTGPAGSLPEAVEENLFRLAQEAVTNALKHAEAGRITIDLEVGDERAVLRVRDDGRGLIPAAAPGHFGLSVMRERAEALGGTLRIGAAPGGGTEVEVDVPR